jgi:hypothetical protein
MCKKLRSFAAEIKSMAMDKKQIWKAILEFIVKVIQIAIAVFLGGNIQI